MTDGPAILNAILANPGDDAVRLIYADWLEEHAADVPCDQCVDGDVGCPSCHGAGIYYDPPYSLNRLKCPKCDDGLLPDKCKKCGGSGVASDGNRERATFIRSQIRLARWVSTPSDLPGGSAADGGPAGEALAVSQALLNAHWRAWIAPLTSGECHVTNLHGPNSTPLPVWVTFARGFVSSVTLSLAAFVGGPCERCDRTGLACPDEYEHGPDGYFDPAGLYPENDPADPDCADCGTKRSEHVACPACGGRGTTPGVAERLFKSQPIERVVLSDREPLRWLEVVNRDWAEATGPGRHTRERFSWRKHPTNGPTPIYMPDHLPDEIMAILFALPDADVSPNGIATRHPTRAAAVDALSLACVRFGRGLAGLPDVENPNGDGHGTAGSVL